MKIGPHVFGVVAFLLALWLTTAVLWAGTQGITAETVGFALLIPLFFGAPGILVVAALSRFVFHGHRARSAPAYAVLAAAAFGSIFLMGAISPNDAGYALWGMLGCSLGLAAAIRDCTLLWFSA
jgi:hypothetical protein